MGIHTPHESHSLKPLWMGAAALSLIIGATATLGGAALIARDDGRLLGLSTALLVDTPFRDFLIPGIFLVGVVGVMNLYAASLLFRRRREGPGAVICSGAALLGWMAVQMMYIGFIHAFQPVCVGVGVVLVFLGLMILEEKHRLRHA